ncbi:DsrE family protein [Sulfurimonas diazotrophicus]|uniref:DsrE family protein n=1 Tax=Sulfurimonas diazotrophicus TaxID=3131939 RepID=A0ABZ3HCW4_9BACT
MSKTKLLIVWTNGDKEVAMKLPLLYGSVILERGYWEEAHLMIWGPSIKLAAADEEVQARLKQMQESGVTMSACIVCTDDYNATEALAAQGIENTHTGEMLTECLKDDTWAVMTV